MKKNFKEYFLEKYPNLFIANTEKMSDDDMREIMRECEDMFFVMLEEYENWKKEQ